MADARTRNDCKWLWGAVVAVATLTFALAAGAGERSRLEKLKEDIRRQEKDLRSAEGKVLASLDGIEEQDKRIEEIDKTLLEISAEVVETSGRMSVIEADLAESEKELEQRRHRLSRHLRLVYKWGRFPVLSWLVRADDFSDAVRRVRFALLLAREDRRLARAVARKRDEIKRDRDVLQQELDYLKSLQQLNLKELNLSRDRRAHKKKLLGDAKTRRDLLEKRLSQMKREKNELEELLRSKTSGGRPGTKKPGTRGGKDLLAKRGKVDGPTRGTVIRRFGLIEDDRYGTVTKNDGVDIEAPLGSSVKAFMKGKVIFADWFRGYGKLLIVDHGAGYTTVYAHLGSFAAAPGDAVKEGQLIGTVGDTGYVGSPTLHFEIRRDGVAVDPMKWIK